MTINKIIKPSWRSFLILTLILIVAGLFIILFSDDIQAEDLPPASGDWNVDEATTIKDQNINLTGNLTILAGGTLNLYNVSLNISGDFNGHHGILIRPGGTLKLLEKIDPPDPIRTNFIQANASEGSKRFFFISELGSIFEMKNTNLSHCGWEAADRNSGLTIFTDDTKILNSNFRSGYRGLFFSGTLGGTVSNCTFAGLSSVAVYGNESTSLAIDQCNMSGGSGHGVYLYNSSFCSVLNCNMSGYENSQFKAHLKDGSGVTLYNSDNNTVQSNMVNVPLAARGIWLQNSVHNKIYDNVLNGVNTENTWIETCLGVFKSSHNHIKNNSMHHVFMGVYVNYHSHYNRIENNWIDFSTRALSLGDPIYGAWDEFRGPCNYNYFGNNTVNRTDFHGFVIIEGCSYNYIYNTTFMNAVYRFHAHPHFGFYIENADYTTVDDTKFINNTKFDIGIAVKSSEGCLIKNNSCGPDGSNGELIWILINSENNVVENNTVWRREWSISIQSDSSNNIVRNNTVFDCDYGITVLGNCHDNHIYNNKINETVQGGIYFFDFGDPEMLRNVVENNTIWDCQNGIHSTPNSGYLTLKNNTIYNCNTGILLEQNYGHYLKDNLIQDCLGGVRVDGGRKVKMDTSNFNNINTCPIEILNADGVEIFNNAFSSFNLVCRVRASINITLHDNIFTLNNNILDINESCHVYFYNNEVSQQGVGLLHTSGILEIRSCLFHNNTAGVEMQGADCSIEDSEFIDNVFGIHYNQMRNSRIENCTFSGNNKGILASDSMDIDIEKCKFTENTGFSIFTEGNSEITLYDPVITEETAGAILTLDASIVDIEIRGITRLRSQSLMIRGEIRVRANSNLLISASDIGFMGAQPGDSGILVESRGTLLIDTDACGLGGESPKPTKIHSSTKVPFFFLAKNESRVEMMGTTISGCGFENGTDPDISWGAGFDSAYVNLTGVSFQNSYCGAVFWECDLILERCSFRNSPYWSIIYSSNMVFNECSFLQEETMNQTVWCINSQSYFENCSFPQEAAIIKMTDSSRGIFTNTLLSPGYFQCDASSKAQVRYSFALQFYDAVEGPFGNLNYTIIDGKGMLCAKGHLDLLGQSQVHYLTSFWISDTQPDHTVNPYTITIDHNGTNISFTFHVYSLGRESFVVNFAPVALVEEPHLSFPEGRSLMGHVDLNQWFSDEGNLSFEYFCTGNLSIHIGADGVVNIFCQDKDWFGIQNIKFTATDEFGLRTGITLVINVTPVNDPPTIQGLADISLGPGETYYLDILGLVGDIDTPLDQLNFSVEPGSLEFLDNYLLIPYLHDKDMLVVTLTVSDGEDASSVVFNVWFLDEISPLFHIIPHQFLQPNVPLELDLSEYYNLTIDQKVILSINVSTYYGILDGSTLTLEYPDGVPGEKVYVLYWLDSKLFARHFNVTVGALDHEAVLLDIFLTNRGNNYSFNAVVVDTDGDMPEVALLLNGARFVLELRSGNITDGAIFSGSFDMLPGQYKYRFEVNGNLSEELSMLIKTEEGSEGSSKSTESGWPWWIYILIALLVLLVLLVAVMLVRSMGAGKEEFEDEDFKGAKTQDALDIAEAGSGDMELVMAIPVGDGDFPIDETIEDPGPEEYLDEVTGEEDYYSEDYGEESLLNEEDLEDVSSLLDEDEEDMEYAPETEKEEEDLHTLPDENDPEESSEAEVEDDVTEYLSDELPVDDKADLSVDDPEDLDGLLDEDDDDDDDEYLNLIKSEIFGGLDDSGEDLLSEIDDIDI